MREAKLWRFLQQVVMILAPIPVALIGPGCGGKTSCSLIPPCPPGAPWDPVACTCVRASVAEGSLDAGTAVEVAWLDAAPGCQSYRAYCTTDTCTTVDASTEPFRQLDGGVLTNPDCADFCAPVPSGINLVCELADPEARPSLVRCMRCGVGGRLPAGLVGWKEPAGDQVATYFAEMAYLEAASVEAFRVLGRELKHHRAPKALVRAARRAARDEVRHSRIMGALARRYGASPREARVETGPHRSLEAIALDNAIEGCVRETYGAVVATWQAQHAGDPVVRAAFSRIARDEARHAALGWKIASWLRGCLDGSAILGVERARREASRAIAQVVETEPSRDVVREAGVPPAAVARAMARHLAAGLWC